MKKLVLILCVGVLSVMLAMGASAFTDIEDAATEEAVATLESMGVVTGTSATKYSPALTLTRAQVCTMMIRMMGLDSSVDSYMYQSLFADVKSSMWHAGYVNLAYRQGIINGYGNGRFGPDDEITYGQFVTILLRVLGYTETDIGKVWPADYVVFAGDLGIDEDVSLTANDKVSRGDAAILLYNTLQTKAKGANSAYYTTMNGYASAVSVILLDNKVSNPTTGDLLACVIAGSSAAMQYYDQENAISDTFVGSFGSLLLNSAGDAIGFLSDGSEYVDIVVDSAKTSGITDIEGNVVKIGGNVGVITDGSLYTYSSTGYVKVQAHAGQSARLYYDDNGTVVYVYLTTGTDPSTTTVAVASSGAPASAFAEALGIPDTAYHILKNGGRADADALAMHDVAYYDRMTDTLRVSDYKVTGYIEFASPSVSAAETITVSGCEIPVLQCAWDTLGGFTLGSYVTVLLTDNGNVAAVYPAETVTADMYGILSTDGNSIILCGSGLAMKPNDISSNVANNGSLVKIDTSDADRVTCSSVRKEIPKTATVDLRAKTVGDIALAPGCSIYEWGGSGYVYSLDGEYGKSSSDFSEIYWTETLKSSYVAFYHVNSAGQIDILVLLDATGNYYDYGLLTMYKDEKGVSLGGISYKAITITNDEHPNGSGKYLCTIGGSGGYAGIALAAYSKNYTKLAAFARPTVSKTTKASDFYLTADDEWYVTLQDHKIPVSDAVKVYVETTGKWYSGEEGLLLALSSELAMHVYYDRTFETGAQVRMIVLGAE